MATAQAYPVRVDASLYAPPSRGLWLVKWILVIPHYIALAFLWLAFVVFSAVGMVAIVVTGRYPRAIHMRTSTIMSTMNMIIVNSHRTAIVALVQSGLRDPCDLPVLLARRRCFASSRLVKGLREGTVPPAAFGAVAASSIVGSKVDGHAHTGQRHDEPVRSARPAGWRGKTPRVQPNPRPWPRSAPPTPRWRQHRRRWYAGRAARRSGHNGRYSRAACRGQADCAEVPAPRPGEGRTRTDLCTRRCGIGRDSGRRRGSGKHQRPATAHNSGTICTSWGYVRPEKQTVGDEFCKPQLLP